MIMPLFVHNNDNLYDYETNLRVLHCRQADTKQNYNENQQQAITQDSSDTTEHKANTVYNQTEQQVKRGYNKQLIYKR